MTSVQNEYTPPGHQKFWYNEGFECPKNLIIIKILFIKILFEFLFLGQFEGREGWNSNEALKCVSNQIEESGLSQPRTGTCDGIDREVCPLSS